MENINNLIKKIEENIAKIDKGVVLAQEAEYFFTKSIGDAKEIFIKNTDEWRILDRWENESGYVWHPVYKSGVYADVELKKKLTNLLFKIKEIIKTEPIVNTEENEYSFSADQKYEAYRLLVSIFKGASKSIYIVDNFLDEVVFDFIDVSNDKVLIRVITDNQKPVFKRLYLAMKGSGNRNIEGKINNSSHDRYLIIDGFILYSLGASINTIGKKDFMIHRINDKKEEVLLKIKDWWSNGQDIV